MGKVAFGYGNLTDSSTLSGSSWSGGNPLTNLQQRELAVYAESSAADPHIILDHGSAKEAQVFAIVAHTCEEGAATIQVTRGTTSGGSDVYAGAAVTCWPFTPLNADRDGGHFGIFVIADAETTARYTKIALVVSTTVRIGRIFVGPAFVPTYNPQYGKIADDWMAANSSLDRTENGADWAATRTELRSAAFEYSLLTQTQASVLHDIARTHSITGECVYIADMRDRARQQQYGFLGTIRKLSALENPFFLHRSAALGFDERGGAP